MHRATEHELYVYALSSPGLPRRFSVLGRRLQCIAMGGVDAVVERTMPPQGTLDDVQRQHRVVSRLAERSAALLPARFGSSIAEEALRSLVEERHAGIRAALRQVRGCEQMTVRVFGAPDVEEGAASRVPQTGAAYLAQRRRLAHHEPPEVPVIRRELAEVVKAERVEGGRSGVRVTVYHLVPSRRLPQYRRRASVLQSLLAPHAVTVTGPWPVFAFTPELF